MIDDQLTDILEKKKNEIHVISYFSYAIQVKIYYERNLVKRL